MFNGRIHCFADIIKNAKSLANFSQQTIRLTFILEVEVTFKNT